MKSVRTKKVVLTTAVLSLGIVLAACGSNSQGKADKQVLNWNEETELPTLDPSLATDGVSFDMLNNSMDGLYRLGKKSQITPGLAKSTKVSKDGLKYTFKLRKDSKWSNGDPVTAQDFVYSWRRTVDPKTNSSYAYLFDGIKNAMDIANNKKPANTLGIKAQGKYQLVVTLDKQLPYFKLLMGFPIFFPQNEKAVKQYGNKYGTESKYMVYNGPFKMAGWTGTNLTWHLKKNQDYWDKKAVKLDQINFKVNKSTTTSYNLYQSGKLDETELSAEQSKALANKSGYQVLPSATTYYLGFNKERKNGLENEKIRQALSYAIDRKQFVNKVLGNTGMASKGVVSSKLASYQGKDFADAAKTKAGISYDPAKARKLLKEGLAEIGQTKLSYNLLTDDTDANKKSVAFLQSQIEEHLDGKVKISTTSVPFKTRLARSTAGDYDIVLQYWGADFADPITFLQIFSGDNPSKTGGWKDQTFDDMITKSMTTDALDKGKRWNDMIKASQILSQQQVIAPLYQGKTPVMIRSNVKGLITNTAGVSNNWKETYISK
ncbi:oligopeptide ABC transporter substrate-binding protein [Ligilactobacillus salitolerans]|uniref:Oligopeptide ABC transporter substrate-binding protein n=1 Tax=Ligilactobacillus salitolerans TaxID=1808352 RepID=A0A401IQF3_9LACO|nr:peptide ABC transporter substrate-binding protein [Ligilactobacillus salitolerans]GBG93767.1 oligopeptide ABC transporter substrate-binding protein [Ligilactobacillus salitolerans]